VTRLKLLVFGATGATGQQVLAQALQKQHEITAFVRNPGKIAVCDPRLRIVEASVADDPTAVAQSIRGQEAVICTLGRRNSFRSDHLIARSLRTIVPAMETEGVKRFIHVSAFGVGESVHEAPLLPRIMYRLLLSDIFADKKVAEDYLRQSRLDWTIVYPVLLTNGPRTGTYRVGEHLALAGMPRISRADVADFILAQLSDASYRKKIAVISY
jgi:putative NADH-flavin reductase